MTALTKVKEPSIVWEWRNKYIFLKGSNVPTKPKKQGHKEPWPSGKRAGVICDLGARHELEY